MAAKKRKGERLVKVTIRLYAVDVEKAKAKAAINDENYQTIIRKKLHRAMRDDAGDVQ